MKRKEWRKTLNQHLSPQKGQVFAEDRGSDVQLKPKAEQEISLHEIHLLQAHSPYLGEECIVVAPGIEG